MSTGDVPSARVRLAAVASGQLGLFTVEQAHRADVSDWTLWRLVGAGEVERVHRLVYRFVAGPFDDRARALAAALACGQDAVVAYSWAARLHGLGRVPVTDRPETVVVGSRLPEVTGVAAHRTRRLDGLDRSTVDGIPVTSGARTVIDLTDDRLDRDETIALADDAICARVTSRWWLHRRAATLKNGRSGVGILEQITAPGAEGEFWSWLERQFSRVVRRAGLPLPRFNVEVTDAGGFVGFADALWTAGVVVELFGLRFHQRPAERQRDEDKANRYALLGLLVLRFTWHDVVQRPEHVVAQIRRALATRGVSAG